MKLSQSSEFRFAPARDIPAVRESGLVSDPARALAPVAGLSVADALVVVDALGVAVSGVAYLFF
jgi:hypothetical protein